MIRAYILTIACSIIPSEIYSKLSRQKSRKTCLIRVIIVRFLCLFPWKMILCRKYMHLRSKLYRVIIHLFRIYLICPNRHRKSFKILINHKVFSKMSPKIWVHMSTWANNSFKKVLLSTTYSTWSSKEDNTANYEDKSTKDASPTQRNVKHGLETSTY